ncbi:MAG: hypothetical protein ACYC1Y_03550 [Minisyncoccota bacterium]
MDPLAPPLTSSSPIVRPIGTLAIGLIVGAIIGVFVAPYLSLGPRANTDNTYQAGFDAAKKLVENSSIGGALQSPDDIRTLSGIVAVVNGNQFTLHVRSTNPFDDPSLSDRTVLIGATTTVIRLVPKDPKVFQAEMSAFVKTTQSPGSTTQKITPPDPFTRIPATVAEIAVGGSVTVFAAENVKTLKEFSASQVQIEGMATLPSNK